MNIGMYFVFPFAICYQSLRFIRTRGVKKSNWEVISSCNVRLVLKIGLLGLIALFVLSVSVPSAFAQSTESEEQNPIRVILGISYENIQESLEDVTDPGAQALFEDGEAQYLIAMEALENGEIEKAEESALLAMQYFEDSAKEIGELQEVQQATIQPLGLGTAASSIFNVQEGITNTDNETNELRELVKLNNFDDVDFSEYEESVNLAKTLLADGYVPDAQAQLELANTIKDNLYAEIAEIAGDQAAEDIKERLGEQENLGLTKKEIRELEVILEDINDDTSDDSGDEAPGNSGEAPGQNKASSEDESPGNSGEAPGQNKENDNTEDNKFESPEDIPGFGSASGTGETNGNGQGLGLGNIPPGLAKLFGIGDGEISEDLPPGLASVPPGQAKKFEDYSASFEQSPDDFYENTYEADIDGIFETNYDGTNKGNGDGKGKFEAWPGKSGEAPGQEVRKSSNSKCSDLGLNGPLSDTTSSIFDVFTVSGYTAKGNSCKDATSQIRLAVIAPNGTSLFSANPSALTSSQPVSFDPDTNGDWIIKFLVQGFKEDRTVNVSDGPSVSAVNGTVADPANILLNGGVTNGGNEVSWLWEITSKPNGASGPNAPVISDENSEDTSLDASGKEGVYVLSLTYINDVGHYEVATLSITVGP
jgi:hypothetical protein